MATPSVTTPSVTAELESLRARLRGRWVAAGAMRLGAESAAFLVLQFVVDRTLWLPVEARRVVAVLASLLFLWRFATLVARPLRKRVAARDMALAVEKRHPALQGGLASMVEVEAAQGLPPDCSPALLEQWRADVAKRAAAIEFSSIFDSRLLRRLAAAVAVALLVVGGFAVARPAESRIYFQRLAGADVPWPRRTHLTLDVAAANESTHFRVERDDDGRAHRVVVARGASLPVVARAGGIAPDEVLLLVREEGRNGADEIRMAPREGADGEWSYRFRAALRPMELTAAGGDDPGQGAPLEVVVVPPPMAERLVATITPPAYTQRPALREERHEFAVPAGTRLDLELFTGGEVAEARLTLHSDPGTAQPLVADEKTPGLWRATVVAEDSGTINFHLVGKSGFKNLHPIDFPLTVLADRKPSLEIARPAVSDLEATARAVVPFRLLVEDDYGVTRVELVMARGDEPNEGRVVLQGEGSPKPELLAAAGEPHLLDALLDLRELQLAKGDALAPVAEGDTISYRAEVQDNRESPAGTAARNTTLSPKRRIDVVPQSEKVRKLADRQQRVKGAIAATKKSQEERSAGLDALLGAQADGAIETKELTSLEVEQGRVGTSARQASRDLCDIVGEFTLNRLDPAPSAERAVVFLVARLEEGRAGPNFDFTPYVRLAAAQAAGEFGELQQLGNLVTMVDLALQASEKHAARALEQLRGARLTLGGEGRLAQLKEARIAQQKVVETYALLLQKMEEWEDYQEILDLWSGLVDDQKDINERVRGGSGAPPPAERGGTRDGDRR